MVQTCLRLGWVKVLHFLSLLCLLTIHFFCFQETGCQRNVIKQYRGWHAFIQKSSVQNLNIGMISALNSCCGSRLVISKFTKTSGAGANNSPKSCWQFCCDSFWSPAPFPVRFFFYVLRKHVEFSCNLWYQEIWAETQTCVSNCALGLIFVCKAGVYLGKGNYSFWTIIYSKLSSCLSNS